ncbi:MBL fold metallo-hydrolase [Janthinobacterium fluminis]|uniref:MBL fold metallo-hydrolase n=1 Tax=Janthinobacterium fluminis TaxID=2987524 RepID=A0ABT5K6K2_9BURK|nr:MBL fold metallo-hydrolase [Janthinobacterium fluminis]MDC8760033.1 MBL fold metallo-hydrolase [Janthinobacterium fluminis]
MSAFIYRPARTAAFLAALVAATLTATPVLAAAPMAKTNAPGYFRLMLGDVEVTALSDGTVVLPVNKLLTHTTTAHVDQKLAQSFLASPLETSVNAYLINTGDKLVLIDGGAGTLFGPTLGKLVANLKASGYQPEQVDEIYVTHMHSDHVGGLAAGEQRAFPNAVVRADKRESDYWLDPANLAKASADKKGFFQGAVASLGPYVKAGKYLPFEGNVELVPGVRAYASKGHTVGHSSYMVESKGQKLLLIGDLIHVGAVQFDEPDVTISFDGDEQAAAAERNKTFAAAAGAGYLLGATHLSFPGIGHVRAQGKSYRWVPLNYTQLP